MTLLTEGKPGSLINLHHLLQILVALELLIVSSAMVAMVLRQFFIPPVDTDGPFRDSSIVDMNTWLVIGQFNKAAWKPC